MQQARGPTVAFLGAASLIFSAFQHRSGRVIASCRLLLALVFLFAIWLDPAQPVRSSSIGYTLLLAYLLFAAWQLATSWNNWWLDFRFALPAYAVDVLVFLVAVYFTESLNTEFVSPFLASFVFLMMSATIRWDWRITLLAAGVILTCYVATGLLMYSAEIEFEPYRFGRRITYMLLLLSLLIWFGLERRTIVVERFSATVEDGNISEAPPLAAAARYACRVTHAAGAVIYWGDEIERSYLLYESEGTVAGLVPVGTEFLALDKTGLRSAFLFDDQKHRRLGRADARRLSTEIGTEPSHLAEFCQISTGVSAPLIASSGAGQILLYGIAGMCTDDIALAEAVAQEISAAIDREAFAVLSNQATLERSREAIARDLHDSVAQTLVAASYRLEGLRKWILAGKDPKSEFDEFKQALLVEQRHVRSLIAGLRPGAHQQARTVSLCEDLDTLLRNLAQFWRIETNIVYQGEVRLVPLYLSHELQQILREATANAVRHGSASNLSVTLKFTSAQISMTIADNGIGFATANTQPEPRSIGERVIALDGEMKVKTDIGGTALQITLPSECLI